MMLSVLVWLAMQGQVQAATPRMPNCWIDGNEVIHCHRLPKSIRYEDAPAEHVIEIKTRRIVPKHWQAIGPGFFKCEEIGTKPYRLTGKGGLDRVQCFGPTRELWIDGKKYGIIKGLD